MSTCRKSTGNGGLCHSSNPRVPRMMSSRGRCGTGVPNVRWFCAGWGGGDRGICFSANSSNLFRISTCKESRRNLRAINTCETKEFKFPEMNTYRKDGWGRHLSPLAVEAIQPCALATHPTQSLAKVEPLTECPNGVTDA